MKKLFPNQALNLTTATLVAICAVSMAITYKNKPKDYEYLMTITDSTASVYHNDGELVGTVRLQGQLDSLLIDDNQ